MRAWLPRGGWLGALALVLLVSTACLLDFLRPSDPTPTAVLASPRPPIVVTVQVPGPTVPTPVSVVVPTPGPLLSPQPVRTPTPLGAVPGQPLQTPTGGDGKLPVVATPVVVRTPTPAVVITVPTPVPAPTLAPAPTVVIPISPVPAPGTSPVVGAPQDIFLRFVQQSMTGRTSLEVRNNGEAVLETATNQRKQVTLTPAEVAQIRADFQAAGFQDAQSTYGQPSESTSVGMTYTQGPQTKAVVIHGNPSELPNSLQALRLSLESLVSRIAQS